MSVKCVESLVEIVINESGRKIKFTEDVLKIFTKYIQIDDTLEAGGILIGREDKNNGNLIVEYATYPLKKDIRKRYEFLRKDIGHITFYNKLYKENGGIYAYIGEWHTHPQDYPIPSDKDEKNWKKIWKQKKENDFFNMIVGIKGIRIWKCNEKIERIF